MPDSRPEHQLVICVARRSLDPAHIQQLRQLLRNDLDWKYVLAIAERHCVLQLLHLHLKAQVESGVPEWVTIQLETANYENTRTSFFLTGELVKVLSVLEANDIEAIPFKGPVLAMCAYGDAGLREFGDLDIMVRKTDFWRTGDVLTKRDFRPVPDLTRSQEAAARRFGCAGNFENSQGVIVDVHWRLFERHFALDFNQSRLWNRLEPIMIGGKQFRTFSSEDLLLILCLHGFTHLWERLGWISDVANLIESKTDLNWQQVVADATSLGIRRILSLGLLLAHELLGTAVPLEVTQESLVDPEVKKAAAQIQAKLFAERGVRWSLREETVLHLRMRERRRDKLKAALRLLMTPRRFDWMAFSLPAWLFFLYYPLRPIRLAGKYGASLIRGARP